MLEINSPNFRPPTHHFLGVPSHLANVAIWWCAASATRSSTCPHSLPSSNTRLFSSRETWTNERSIIIHLGLKLWRQVNTIRWARFKSKQLRRAIESTTHFQSSTDGNFDISDRVYSNFHFQTRCVRSTSANPLLLNYNMDVTTDTHDLGLELRQSILHYFVDEFVCAMFIEMPSQWSLTFVHIFVLSWKSFCTVHSSFSILRWRYTLIECFVIDSCAEFDWWEWPVEMLWIDGGTRLGKGNRNWMI